MEWTDGVFTAVLRAILNNVKGESSRRHWIVFDGDVDPEWAENLNSVLDDNKLLTLPTGERLSIPDNVRLMFEVQNLKHATLATVSRCGMVWYSEDVVSSAMIVQEHMFRLRAGVIASGKPVVVRARAAAGGAGESEPAAPQSEKRVCSGTVTTFSKRLQPSLCCCCGCFSSACACSQSLAALCLASLRHVLLYLA